ncbi:MAG: UPF0182 family protein, partial [Oculatellaceae cyanobacterium bins.114]|nr:UPF0182 family protein [Oculatellaceae cyanobacterium bins.114]
MTAGQRSPAYFRKWFALLVGGVLLLNTVSFWLAERFWFEEVGYTEVFSRRLMTQTLLGGVVFMISLIFLGSNLAIASQPVKAYIPSEHQAQPSQPPLRLPGFLPIVLGLS